jgi:hypothetical protein
MAKIHKDKPALTLDEHKALGADLHAMNERLSHLTADLSARYSHRIADVAARAATALSALRSTLEDVMFRETRGADRDALLHVYYPGPGASAAPSPPVAAEPKVS